MGIKTIYNMTIRFNRPEDGNFWLTNFQEGYPIAGSLPTIINKNGEIEEGSEFIGENTWEWPTSEHFFQALKFTGVWNRNDILITQIRRADTPDNARTIANNGGRARQGWINPTNYRLNAMKYVVRAKFSQHPELRERLLATAEEELIEFTGGRNDRFWGVGENGDRDGQNWLGRILMEIRLEKDIEARLTRYFDEDLVAAENRYNEEATTQGHWGYEPRGNSWREYLANINWNANDEQELSYNSVKDGLLFALNESIINFLITERNIEVIDEYIANYGTRGGQEVFNIERERIEELRRTLEREDEDEGREIARNREEAVNRYNDSPDPDKEWFIFDGRELREFLEWEWAYNPRGSLYAGEVIEAQIISEGNENPRDDIRRVRVRPNEGEELPGWQDDFKEQVPVRSTYNAADSPSLRRVANNIEIICFDDDNVINNYVAINRLDLRNFDPDFGLFVPGFKVLGNDQEIQAIVGNWAENENEEQEVPNGPEDNNEINLRNICRRIYPNGNEPEYQRIENPLPISSIGTENQMARAGAIPCGSALRTGAGNLEAGGIQAIIHAAPESFVAAGNEENFLKGVALSVKNSMILASQDRYGYRRVAVPFIGSAIFGGTSDREKLAKVVVKSAIEQSANWDPGLDEGRNDAELYFIVWNGETTQVEGRNLNDYFIDAVQEAQRRHPGGRINLVRFDYINELNGQVDAIVNAANTNVNFGGGISGAIGRATGDAVNINDEARGYINDFNRIIDGEELASEADRDREEADENVDERNRLDAYWVDEELTRDYAESLWVSDDQKDRLTMINSRSNWLIFHRDSLDALVSGNGSEQRFVVTGRQLKNMFRNLVEKAGYDDFPSPEDGIDRFELWFNSRHWVDQDWIAINKDEFLSNYNVALSVIGANEIIRVEGQIVGEVKEKRIKAVFLDNLLEDTEIIDSISENERRVNNGDITFTIERSEIPEMVRITYGGDPIVRREVRELSNIISITLAQPLWIGDKEIEEITISRFPLRNDDGEIVLNPWLILSEQAGSSFTITNAKRSIAGQELKIAVGRFNSQSNIEQVIVNGSSLKTIREKLDELRVKLNQANNNPQEAAEAARAYGGYDQDWFDINRYKDALRREIQKIENLFNNLNNEDIPNTYLIPHGVRNKIGRGESRIDFITLNDREVRNSYIVFDGLADLNFEENAEVINLDASCRILENNEDVWEVIDGKRRRDNNKYILNIASFDNIIKEENEETAEEEINENERKVIEWINNGFFLTIDEGKSLINVFENEAVHDNEVNFDGIIFPAIREYIRAHPDEFKLGQAVHENVRRRPGGEIEERPWWSPLIDITDDRDSGAAFGGFRPATTRRIEKSDENDGNFIYPGALTEEQYEELKNLLPGDVSCKVRGCSNNYWAVFRMEDGNFVTEEFLQDILTRNQEAYERWLLYNNQADLAEANRLNEEYDTLTAAMNHQEYDVAYNRQVQNNICNYHRDHGFTINDFNNAEAQWNDLFNNRGVANNQRENWRINFSLMQATLLLDSNWGNIFFQLLNHGNPNDATGQITNFNRNTLTFTYTSWGQTTFNVDPINYEKNQLDIAHQIQRNNEANNYNNPQPQQAQQTNLDPLPNNVDPQFQAQLNTNQGLETQVQLTVTSNNDYNPSLSEPNNNLTNDGGDDPDPSSSTTNDDDFVSGGYGGGYASSGSAGSSSSSENSPSTPISSVSLESTKPNLPTPTKSESVTNSSSLDEITIQVQTKNDENEAWSLPEEQIKAVFANPILTNNVNNEQEKINNLKEAQAILTIVEKSLSLSQENYNPTKATILAKELQQYQQSESVAAQASKMQIANSLQHLQQLQIQKTQVQIQSRPKEESKWLPWTIGGGVLVTAIVLVAFTNNLNKKNKT